MGFQTLVVVLVAVAWGWSSFEAMIAALLGGVISILPGLFFALRFFSRASVSNPRKIVGTFYRGEFLKLLITAVLLLLVLLKMSLPVFPLFSGFLAATLGLWFAPVLSLLPSPHEPHEKGEVLAS